PCRRSRAPSASMRFPSSFRESEMPALSHNRARWSALHAQQQVLSRRGLGRPARSEHVLAVAVALTMGLLGGCGSKPADRADVVPDCTGAACEDGADTHAGSDGAEV